MMKVPDRSALIQNISDNFARSKQQWIQFLFVMTVRSHSGYEASGRNILFSQKEFSRSRASDNRIAFHRAVSWFRNGGHWKSDATFHFIHELPGNFGAHVVNI